jgi:cytochrome c oxidase cbb3-type subunit 4
VITVLMMLTFIGIWIWAWRKQHKATFSRLASLPMEDDLEGERQDGEEDERA